MPESKRITGEFFSTEILTNLNFGNSELVHAVSFIMQQKETGTFLKATHKTLHHMSHVLFREETPPHLKRKIPTLLFLGFNENIEHYENNVMHM